MMYRKWWNKHLVKIIQESMVIRYLTTKKIRKSFHEKLLIENVENILNSNDHFYVFPVDFFVVKGRTKTYGISCIKFQNI